MNTQSPISGLDLKVMRVQRRLTAKRIAAAMGVSPSRINRIEGEQFPSAEMVARYVAALDTCAASATSRVA